MPSLVWVISTRGSGYLEPNRRDSYFLHGDWARQELEPALEMPCLGCVRL
jgi:hypothetical protein